MAPYNPRFQLQVSPTMMLAFRRRFSVTHSFGEIIAAAGFALALLASTHADAQRFEPSLVYMLPVYCKYTQYFRNHLPGGNNPAEIERWTASMGDMFNHMHHYCLGLMASNRAMFLSDTRQDRAHNLGNSITEFDYVIQRAPPGYPMLPEMLTKKGESLIRLDRAGEGIVELKQAIRIKADYSLAYAAMSDYYKGTGELANAREWLEKGLSVAPNAQALLRRLAELDRSKDKGKTAPGTRQ
jgi:tetratricopeptide (TPR) repeat protein